MWFLICYDCHRPQKFFFKTVKLRQIVKNSHFLFVRCVNMHQTGCLSRSKIAGLDQSHDTQVTMVTCKNARGRTKEVLIINYKSFVFLYQHGATT